MTFDEWMQEDIDGQPRYKQFRNGSSALREAWNAAASQFNLTFQHDPPEVGDTKWIRVRFAGRQAPRQMVCDDDWMTE